MRDACTAARTNRPSYHHRNTVAEAAFKLLSAETGMKICGRKRGEAETDVVSLLPSK